MKGCYKIKSEPAWLTRLIAEMDGTRVPRVWFQTESRSKEVLMLKNKDLQRKTQSRKRCPLVAHAEPKMCDGILFSDGVIREEGTGKITLIGMFQHFNVPKLPFFAPPFFVTAIFTNLRPPIEKLHLTVRMEDSRTGHVVASTGAEIGFNKDPDLSDVFEIPVQMPPTQLIAGVYKVVVLADNELIGSRILPVRSVTGITQQ